MFNRKSKTYSLIDKMNKSNKLNDDQQQDHQDQPSIKIPNNFVAHKRLKFLTIQLVFCACSLVTQSAHSSQDAKHPKSTTVSEHQQQQAIISDDLSSPFDGFGDANTAAVSLRDNHLQRIDFNSHQRQEDMKEFAASMMHQLQLTDTHFGASNLHPRMQDQQHHRQQQHHRNNNNNSNANCISNRDELDRCSAQLIAFGSSKASYPHDMDEVNNVYCPRVKKLLSCIKDSSTCYSRFDRQVIDWIISSTRKMSNKRCKNENEKQRFVRMVNSCFEPMSSMKDKCMRNYIGSLDAIAESTENNNTDLNINEINDDISIQLSCCANKRFKSCMIREAKNHCRLARSLVEKLRRTNSISSQSSARKHHKKSMKDMMDDMESTLDAMALSGPELFCRGVQEDFCKLKFDNKFSNKSPKHKSIVPSMITIYSQRTTP